MAVKDVSAEVEWEARRIAAAFGIEQWKLSISTKHIYEFETVGSSPLISWSLFYTPIFIEWIRIGQSSEKVHCLAVQEDSGWHLPESPLGPAPPQYQTLMARGCYCLGVTDKTILERLPLLSMHEKLELRLTMPREFWPQKWLDAEATEDSKK